MTPRAAHYPPQFIAVRGGLWHVGAPPERPTPVNPRVKIVVEVAGDTILHSPPIGHFNEPPTERQHIRHDPPTHHFNEPSSAPPDPIAPSHAPLSAFDRLTKHDPEHGIIKYNNKLLMDRDVNAEAFGDDPRSRRPTRANLGYSAVKRKGWK